MHKVTVPLDDPAAYEKAINSGLDRRAAMAVLRQICTLDVELEIDTDNNKAKIAAVDGRPVLSEAATQAAKDVEDWMTRAEAEAAGYKVMCNRYPWVAYKEASYGRESEVCVLTDLEAVLLGKI